MIPPSPRSFFVKSAIDTAITEIKKPSNFFELSFSFLIKKCAAMPNQTGIE